MNTVWHQAAYWQRRKMLPDVGSLIDYHRRFTLDQESIEVFLEKESYRFPDCPDDLHLDSRNRADDTQGCVFKDWVGVQDQDSDFHR